MSLSCLHSFFHFSILIDQCGCGLVVVAVFLFLVVFVFPPSRGNDRVSECNGAFECEAVEGVLLCFSASLISSAARDVDQDCIVEDDVLFFLTGLQMLL